MMSSKRIEEEKKPNTQKQNLTFENDHHEVVRIHENDVSKVMIDDDV